MLYCTYQDSTPDIYIHSNIALCLLEFPPALLLETPSDGGLYMTLYPQSRPNTETLYPKPYHLLKSKKQYCLLLINTTRQLAVFIVRQYIVMTSLLQGMKLSKKARTFESKDNFFYVCKFVNLHAPFSVFSVFYNRPMIIAVPTESLSLNLPTEMCNTKLKYFNAGQ